MNQPNQTLHLPTTSGWWETTVPGLTANNEAAQVGAFEANAIQTICRAMASELVRKPHGMMDPWMGGVDPMET